MEGTESKSPMKEEDSQISPEISEILAETIEECQQIVDDILEEIEEDENFSEMTAENYDKKKSYLRKHLNELWRLHRLLDNQHVSLIKEVSKNCPSMIKNQHLDSSDPSSPQVIQMLTPYQKSNPLKLKKPIDFDFVSRESGGFNISKREGSESSSPSSSGYESTMSTSKHLSSPVRDEPISDKKLLEDGNTKLKPEFQENESDTETEKSHLEANEAEIIELQKQVADLKLEISESDIKIKTMEEELLTSRKSLSIAKDTISILKGEPSKVFQQNQMLKYEVGSSQNLLTTARKQLTAQLENFKGLEKQVESCVAEITVRDDQIAKLQMKNERYKSDILQLEEILKSKEGIWNHDVIKLKVQLKNKSKAFDDLKKQLNTSWSDRNRLNGKLETLEEEKCSHEKLIQELQTRLDALQVEHERVVSSFENAEKLKNDLTLKVVELEREVDKQREAISVTTEEKIEAIRQLSFSLEHYMSKYKQLRQSSAANKTFCFGFLSGLNTQ